MKKSVLFTIIAILFVSCGSSPKATGTDELDIAIREASDYLNTRIPKGDKIAFVNMQSTSNTLSEYIINGLIENTVNDGMFPVIDRQQLDAIRAELNFQYSGEVDDNSAQALGKILGVKTIITGSVTQMGDLYRFTVRAMAVETAQIQGQFGRNIPRGRTIIALLGSGGSSSGSSSSARATSAANTTSASARQAAAPAATTRLANGTYSFWPRLKVTKAGLPVNNIFIPQVTVAGGYMTIHFARTERGPWAVGTEWDHGPSGFYDTRNFVLRDLDNPSRSYNPVSAQSSDNGMGRIWSISYRQMNSKRYELTFKMYDSDTPPYIIDEIILGEPDL